MPMYLTVTVETSANRLHDRSREFTKQDFFQISKNCMSMIFWSILHFEEADESRRIAYGCNSQMLRKTNENLITRNASVL